MYRLFGVLLVAGASGCMKTTLVSSANPAGPAHLEKANFYLQGLIGEHDVDLAKICPNGVAFAQSRMSAGDCILGAITCSIYTPRTIEVRCAGGGGEAFLLEPDETKGMTMVTEMAAGGAR